MAQTSVTIGVALCILNVILMIICLGAPWYLAIFKLNDDCKLTTMKLWYDAYWATDSSCSYWGSDASGKYKWRDISPYPENQIHVADVSLALSLCAFFSVLFLCLLYLLFCCTPSKFSGGNLGSAKVVAVVLSVITMVFLIAALAMFSNNWPSAMRNDDDPLCRVSSLTDLQSFDCKAIFESFERYSENDTFVDNFTSWKYEGASYAVGWIFAIPVIIFTLGVVLATIMISPFDTHHAGALIK